MNGFLLPTPPSVLLGLEPSIHTASSSSSRMDPRLRAWDDGECGGILAKRAVSVQRHTTTGASLGRHLLHPSFLCPSQE
ncbi:hypothetical protein EFR00_14255 [Rhizobium sophoriradicis]|nr:hypothetical protein EFR00_14255 [Rhizobium sophoriradicis]